MSAKFGLKKLGTLLYRLVVTANKGDRHVDQRKEQPLTTAPYYVV